ncbi:MAG: winged helix-turn-helix transcriptional regulator [Ferrovibrio sp.]|jgi:DNA-binding HxlR family transcriptional regulator|uniref:winged helix-turn-helix transcriptional regulator n=1 Tax=Ferrovibrio sp. TaxID=1917215 RepID=UPI00391B6965
MPASPRRSVRGSTTGRPIMAVLDLLGRRWSLRVLWELRDAPLTFRALQAACDDISPSVLQQRLKDLRQGALVDHDGEGYALTASARALMPTLLALNTWAEDWAKGRT